MKEKLNHWYRALTAMLLTVLGFSSCGKSAEGGENSTYCLYGTPTSTFQVKGCITSEDNTPIEGIKAVVGIDYQEAGIVHQDSAYTDKQGNYVIAKKRAEGTPDNKYMKILLEDVDGEANGGTFANDTIKGDELTIEKTGDGDGNWYIGSYTITANKKLKKKQ